MEGCTVKEPGEKETRKTQTKTAVVEEENLCEYIYLLREREFVRMNEPVYKIGRTKQAPNDRFTGYPKGSEIELYVRVNDSVNAEKQLVNLFKREFKQRKDYGNEYFEGDVKLMVKSISNVATNIDDINDLKTKLETAEKMYKDSKAKLEELKASILALVSSNNNNTNNENEKENETKNSTLSGYFVKSNAQMLQRPIRL
jgi:hypothetical protein